MSKEDKSALLARREGVLELCHNWGTGSFILRSYSFYVRS